MIGLKKTMMGSRIAGTEATYPAEFITGTRLGTEDSMGMHVARLTDTLAMIVLNENGADGRFVPITRSGENWSPGSVGTFYTGLISYTDVTRLTDTSVMIVWRGTGWMGFYCTVTWNGSSWVASSASTFTTGNDNGFCITAMTSTSVLVAYPEGYTGLSTICPITWNGSAWVVGTPVTTGAGKLWHSITRVTDTVAMMVCYDATSTFGMFSAISWNGSAWVASIITNFSGSFSAAPNSVIAMTSDTTLVAYRDHAGDGKGRVVAITWNGSAWVAGTPFLFDSSPMFLYPKSFVRLTDTTALLVYQGYSQSYCRICRITYIGGSFTAETPNVPGFGSTLSNSASIDSTTVMSVTTWTSYASARFFITKCT